MKPPGQAPLDGRAFVRAEGARRAVARPFPFGVAARTWVWPVLLFALAVSLRFYRLGAPSLWVDEGASLRDALELSPNASYRPLYYLVLRLWAPLGSGEAWLRAPSALCSAAAVMLLYRLARRVSGTRVAVLAASLMALSVQELDHAQEVRMYALAAFLSLAAVFALLRWLDKRDLPSLVGYLALAALAFATSPATVLLVLPAGGYAAWRLRRERRDLARLSGGGLAVLLAVAPLMPATDSGLTRFASFHPSFLPPPLAELAYLPAKLLVAPIGFLAHASAVTALFKGLGVCCLILLALAAFAPGREPGLRRGRLLAVWFALPCVGLFVFAHAVTPLWAVRYFLPLAPVLYLVLAIGLAQLLYRSRVTGVAVAAFVLAGLTVRVAFYFVEPQREDWRAAVAWGNAVAMPGDAVCLPDSSAATVWEYYDHSGLPTREFRDDATNGAGTGERLAVVLQQMPIHTGRTLLVTRGAPFEEALESALSDYLTARGRLLGTFRSGPLTVRVVLPESSSGIAERVGLP